MAYGDKEEARARRGRGFNERDNSTAPEQFPVTHSGLPPIQLSRVHQSDSVTGLSALSS